MLIEKDGIKQEGTPIEGLEINDLKNASDAFSNIGNDKEKSGEETTPASSPEKKPEDGTATPPVVDKKGEDDDVPFHKHPRFKELIKSNKELQEQNELLATKIEEINTGLKKGETTNTNVSPADSKLLSTFEQLYGTNDPNAFNLWKQATIEAVGYNEDKVIEKYEKKLEERKANEQKELDKWKGWVNERVDEVIESKEVLPEERDELLKVMEDYKPTYAEGNLNFHKGAELLKLFKQFKPNTSKERKKLAGQISSNSSSETSNDNSVQSNVSLRHKSFSELARE
jgi:hypothetical protein